MNSSSLTIHSSMTPSTPGSPQTPSKQTKKPTSKKQRGLWKGIPGHFFTSGPTFDSVSASPTNPDTIVAIQDGNLFVSYNQGKQWIQLTAHQSLVDGHVLGRIHVQAANGGKSYCWSMCGMFLFFVTERFGLYRLNIDGGEPYPLMDEHQYMLFSPSVSTTGSLICCMETKSEVKLLYIEKATSIVDHYEVLSGSLGHTFQWDPVFHPKYSHLVALHGWNDEHMPWNWSKIILLNLKTRKSKLIAGGKEMSCCQPKFSPNANRLSFVSDKDGYYKLYSVQISSREKVEKRDCIIETKEFEMAYNSYKTGLSSYCWLSEKNIAYGRNENGFWTLHVHDIESNESNQLLADDLLPGYFHSFQAVKTINFGDELKFIVQYEAPNEIGQTLLVNATKNTFTVILQNGLQIPDLIRERFVYPMHFSYENSKEEIVHGLLYVAGEKSKDITTLCGLNLPTITYIHEGPIGMAMATCDPLIQYFASRGFLVFCPNFRGSLGYGREYRESINGNWGEFDVKDTFEGIQYLLSMGIADDKKSVLVGRGSGGTTVLNYLGHYEYASAGITLCPISDLLAMKKTRHKFERSYTQQLIGPLPEMSKTYRLRSPISTAKSVLAPLLLIHGNKDDVVSVEQSEQYYDLVKNSCPVTFKKYDSDHHLQNVMGDILQLVEDFILEHVIFV